MTNLTTRYEFTLPRGYVDAQGRLHRTGVMRLATARDELEPLRDPGISGPDDPRLTILVLARVVEQLGELELVTSHEIEGLFAADLAYLQDFYGAINFGSREEYEDLVRSQQETSLVGVPDPQPEQPPAPEPAAQPAPAAASPAGSAEDGIPSRPPTLRSAVEEFPRRAQ
jgi:hypothetical protein